MIYFQSLTQSELAELLLPLSRVRRPGDLTDEMIDDKCRRQARYRAKQLFHWVYQKHETDWDQMSDLSKDLREWLKTNVEICRLKEHTKQDSLDGTLKFLWNLGDSKTIESVIIPAALQEKDEVDSNQDETDAATSSITPSLYAGKRVEGGLQGAQWSRLTACISSQVGCAMACKFCLTGIQGLDRHLQTHEIVTQVHELRRIAPITNIVFMGMGEPLHNLDNVAKACQILLDQDGMSFSKRKITVSTSGLVPAIVELGKRVDVSLAISLNATTDEQRSHIMPVNKKWPIAELLKACREYPLGAHRRITFEYVMLKDFNDTLEDAARLVRLMRGIPSKINLIPFNEHSGAEFKRPTDDTVRKFQRYLLDRELTATVRISRGRDILAACGQLRSVFGTARGTERHRDWAPAPAASTTGSVTSLNLLN